MQISNSVSSGAYLSYRKPSGTNYGKEFRWKEDAEQKGEEKVMQDYLEAGISKQYEDCRKLMDAFGQMKHDSDENSVTETALEENTDI